MRYVILIAIAALLFFAGEAIAGSGDISAIGTQLKSLQTAELHMRNLERVRGISSGPPREIAKVTTIEYSADTWTLKFDFALLGDYDMDGEVGIPDITVVAQNFGKQVGDDEFLKFIDTSGDGEIGISDITEIALNYQRNVRQFVVYTTDINYGWEVGMQVWSVHATRQFERPVAGPGIPQFSLKFDSPPDRYIKIGILDSENNREMIVNQSFDLGGKTPQENERFRLFLDTGTGNEFWIVDGLVIVVFMVPLNTPEVVSFVAEERLSILTDWTVPEIEFYAVLAQLPGDVSVEDAVYGWPPEYPDLLKGVAPDTIGSTNGGGYT